MIKRNLILLVYNKDVTCVIDPGKEPNCTTTPRISRRSNIRLIPSHDPYIPRKRVILFNCAVRCQLLLAKSMTQLSSPKLNLKLCFAQKPDSFECESIRYHYLKNADKIVFLSDAIQNKKFFLVDCLVYQDGGRICHKKNNVNSYSHLIDTGALARPKEPNVLAQEEFICEETEDKEINCDLNPYVPFTDGLKPKETVKLSKNVLFKSGSFVIILKRKCKRSWCGYSGRVTSTRRMYPYSVPGGMVYLCYYANKQRVCKQVFKKDEKEIYNQRGWLSS